MKHICLALALAVVLGANVACGSSDDSRKTTPVPAAGNFTLAGFADHAAPDNAMPPDLTAAGGTLKSCNPQRLFAFVKFSDLTPPKQFVGSWTLNGAALNTQTFTQTAASATSFFEVQNTPQPLTAGAYRFQLAVDNNVVSQGSFTLAC